MMFQSQPSRRFLIYIVQCRADPDPALVGFRGPGFVSVQPNGAHPNFSPGKPRESMEKFCLCHHKAGGWQTGSVSP